MATIYVATSKGLANWGSDVGLTKYIYKVGLTTDSADAAVKALNDSSYAGQADWKLAKKLDGIDADEATILARVTAKEKAVDPTYYPRIKNTTGIFKLKIANVESQLLVQQALKGEDPHLVKVKAADIALYLLNLAAQGAPG
ncbi:MAG TPA: hypothetical protein VG742_10125 [Dongiaceae bacterium]|nr:hypothetical protein [Dongiaceae bacterium]